MGPGIQEKNISIALPDDTASVEGGHAMLTLAL